MPKKGKRVTTKEIKKVIEKGKINNSKYFSIKKLKKNSPTTLSVVVSKKVAHKAVDRNKIKRRIREALKSVILPTNIAIVIYAKKELKELSFKEIENEIIDLLMTRG